MRRTRVNKRSEHIGRCIGKGYINIQRIRMGKEDTLSHNIEPVQVGPMQPSEAGFRGLLVIFLTWRSWRICYHHP